MYVWLELLSHSRVNINFASYHQGLTILCQTLLSLPKYNDAFLTVSTFEVFEALFKNNGNGFANNGIDDIIKVCLLLFVFSIRLTKERNLTV